MKCPYCGKKMEKGVIEARDSSLLNIGGAVAWMPEGEEKKVLRKGTVNLALTAEGYYCEECGKAVAIFDKRGAGFFQ